MHNEAAFIEAQAVGPVLSAIWKRMSGSLFFHIIFDDMRNL